MQTIAPHCWQLARELRFILFWWWKGSTALPSLVAREKLARRVLLGTQIGKVDQGLGGVIASRPNWLVTSCCGDSRTIRGCWKQWGILGPRKAAVPATVRRDKACEKSEWICFTPGINTEQNGWSSIVFCLRN